MSGGLTGGNRWPHFTAVQWQELEHQTLIFKYLKYGLRVPPDLLAPIHRSLESMSTKFFQYPTCMKPKFSNLLPPLLIAVTICQTLSSSIRF